MHTRALPEPDGGPGWRIGQLAEATGVSVRSLRHYDEIGLLVPSGRDAAGHRRYTAAEVNRLYRVLALRGFGLALGEIRRLLDGADVDPRELFRQQLAQVDERITSAHRLRQSLIGVLAALDHAAEPSVRQVLDLIEGMITMRRPLTPEQLAEMVAERRRAAELLTPEQRAELTETRRRWLARISPADLAAAHRARAEMLPPGWSPPSDEETENRFGP
ncbi:MerR family transcriptional regulator [Plantactinospora siamensis]|uniref:MerR family transcriptional regulator n=1 Tax=Plantactinospora siamensis TaxID=555372 RepID=A0ABV6NXW9_9ACTN